MFKGFMRRTEEQMDWKSFLLSVKYRNIVEETEDGTYSTQPAQPHNKQH